MQRNLFEHVFLVVLVNVTTCPGDLTSANILAAITRPPNQYCNIHLTKRAGRNVYFLYLYQLLS